MTELSSVERAGSGNRLRLVANGWAYLDRLSTGKLFLKQVAEELDMESSQASRELAKLVEGGLVSSSREGKHMFYLLTEYGRHWVDNVRKSEVETTTPVHPRTADSSEVEFLLGKIKSSRIEGVEEAERLLLQIVTISKVSKSDAGSILSKAKRFLSDNNRTHRSRWLRILQALLTSSDDATRLRIARDFRAPLLEMISTPELQGPAREIATAIMQELLGKEEWYAKLRELVETEAREIPKGKNDSWVRVEDALIDSLKEMYRSDRMATWKWLFGLIETDNESVRLRAQNLIQRLKD